MKKIKIFVDGHWFDDLYQSTCVFLKGLYSELLQDERFQIYIAAVDTNQLKKVFNYSDKINYLPYRSSSKYYRLAADIPRLIRQHNIDVSHFQYVSPLVKNSIEIVTIHDILFKEFKELFPWNYRFTKDFLFKRSAKRAELVTTVSQYSCDAIMKHYSIPSERIKIVPNGISEDFFTLNSQEGHSIREKNKLKEYVLYVSRIEPRKNHLSLLKAYVQAELWKDSIKLVFVGRTDIQVSELNDLMSSLPDYIFKNIVWLENVGFKELIDLYKNASLFVYPSLAEGFGIPPLEAASLKVKTLCSNATAMSDFSFFEHDLFNPNDITELAMKMRLKIQHDDLNRRNEISELIKDRYCWRKIGDNFSSLICGIMR